MFSDGLKGYPDLQKHLDIHINQKVMNGELVFYPQMYPFLQQLRVDYSGRTEGGGVKREIPHPVAQLMRWARPSCYALQ